MQEALERLHPKRRDVAGIVVAKLDRLPPKGFTVIALPMKIGAGSGGPLRIVAAIP